MHDAGTYVAVSWADACVCHGQASKEEWPTPTNLTSVGIVAEETDAYITVARELGEDGEYRALISIPRDMILAVVVLSAESTA